MRKGSSAAMGSARAPGIRAKRNADHLRRRVVGDPRQHDGRNGQARGPPRNNRAVPRRFVRATRRSRAARFPPSPRSASPTARIDNGCSSCGFDSGSCNRFRLVRPEARGNKAQQKLVIEQQKSQREHQVIQKRVIRRENDADLPRRDDEEADQPHAAREEHHEHKAQLQPQRSCHRGRVEPVRQMLGVPADPRGQRAVLVVLVHGREVAPLRVAAHQLHHARFEVDAEPLPLQQEPTGARGRIARAPSRHQARAARKTAPEIRPRAACRPIDSSKTRSTRR